MFHYSDDKDRRVLSDGNAIVVGMNRRELLRGSAAMIGGSYLSPAFGKVALGQSANEVAGPTKRLLSSTYTLELLGAHLVPVGQWHPYPRATEREGWMQVPEDLRAAMVKRAEVWKGKEWPSLLATTALDFKRNGNRTRYESAQFGRRQRLIDLVLGECAVNDGRYLDEIANGIWLICEETFWGAPAHLGAQKAKAGLPDISEPIVDLFAAETASTLAWMDYLLGEKLNAVSPLISRASAWKRNGAFSILCWSAMTFRGWGCSRSARIREDVDRLRRKGRVAETRPSE